MQNIGVTFMRKRYRGRIRKTGYLFFLMALFCLMIAGTALGTEVTAEDGRAVSQAKQNRISKGKWVKTKNRYRYRQKNGDYVKSAWTMIDGKIYRFDEKGYVKTGAFSWSGNKYYADQQGRIYIKKFLKKGTKVYYYGAAGARVRDRWIKSKGKYYYFCRTGQMVRSSWVGTRYVGADGARVSAKTVQGRKLDKNGVIRQISASDKCIIVGASRIVDMSVAVNSKDTVFIAKSGQGYRWLKSDAGPQLCKYLKKYPKCKVVFQLGNNDLGNINCYISYYKALMKKYPKASFYFMDALPGDAGSQKNERRKVFNKALKAAMGSRYIGGYSYLEGKGFTTIDGTHYPAEISQMMYHYIMRKIK